MTTTNGSLLASLLFFVPACGLSAGGTDSGPIMGPSDAGSVQDAAQGVDCALPDASPSVQLTTLADFCGLVSRGSHQLDLNSAYGNIGRCGQSLTDDDLLHITAAGIKPAPSCTDGPLAERMRRLEASIAMGRISYAPDQASACAAAGRMMPGGNPIVNGQLITPCAQIIRGTVGIGGACAMHEECASKYCKETAIDSCGGTCAEPLTQMTACEPRRDICAEGSDCHASSDGTWRCAPRLSSGSTCDRFSNCDSNLNCVGGTCQGPLGEGMSCLFDQGPPNCGAGLACVAPSPGEVNGVCTKLAQVGEACSDGQHGHPPCASKCEACSAQGLCIMRGDPGAVCSSSEECVITAWCSGSRACVARPRHGESCAMGGPPCLYDDDECSGGTCIARPPICLSPTPPLGALKSTGEGCASDKECAGGYCSVNGHVCAAPCSDGCVGNYLDFYAYLVFFAGMIRVKRSRQERRPPSPSGMMYTRRARSEDSVSER
jgi:hypothetical protein